MVLKTPFLCLVFSVLSICSPSDPLYTPFIDMAFLGQQNISMTVPFMLDDIDRPFSLTLGSDTEMFALRHGVGIGLDLARIWQLAAVAKRHSHNHIREWVSAGDIEGGRGHEFKILATLVYIDEAKKIHSFTCLSLKVNGDERNFVLRLYNYTKAHLEKFDAAIPIFRSEFRASVGATKELEVVWGSLAKAPVGWSHFCTSQDSDAATCEASLALLTNNLHIIAQADFDQSNRFVELEDFAEVSVVSHEAMSRKSAFLAIQRPALIFLFINAFHSCQGQC